MGYQFIPESELHNDRKEFRKFIQRIHRGGEKIVVAEFYSTTCGFCGKVDAFLQKKLVELGKSKDVIYMKVNVNTFNNVSSGLRVRGVPHVMNFTQEGYPDFQIVGANQANLDAFIEMMRN
jgi:thioredoxin-like negative regulator of GroEL